MKRAETARILKNARLWITDVGDVRYAFTSYWASPLPACVAGLLEHWNLTPEPGSYEFDGLRATRSPAEVPDVAKLLVDLPKEPSVTPVMHGGQHSFVVTPGKEMIAIMTNGTDDIFVNHDYLNIATDDKWPIRLMACVSPRKPLAIWDGPKATIIMPIRLAS